MTTTLQSFPHYINGQAIDSTDRNTDVNPSNVQDVVGEFARATSAELDQAIASAREAFKKWSRTTPQERFDILDRAGTEILARKDELGRLLSREQGKPLADGIGEAARAGYIFKFRWQTRFASLATSSTPRDRASRSRSRVNRWRRRP
jgi:aldehyde dehydrogenase (NAD+)